MACKASVLHRSTRIEKAYGIRNPYRPYMRHKQTVLPPHRDFTKPLSVQSEIPWRNEATQRYYDQKHARKHAPPPKGYPSKYDSQASMYQYCTELCEARFFDHVKGKKLLREKTQRVHEALSNPFTSQTTFTDQTHFIWHALSTRNLMDQAVGFLALSGKSYAQTLLLQDLYTLYPRLRAKHLEDLLGTCFGLQNVAEVGIEIGMARVSGCSTDVHLWRELSFLNLRLKNAKSVLSREEDKVLSGNLGERIYHYKRNITATKRQLYRRSPARTEDLLSRMYWFRFHVFAWLAYVRYTQGRKYAQYLTRRLFYPSIAELMPEFHPLERKRARICEAEGAAGGWIASTVFISKVMERRLERYPNHPTILIHTINPDNPLKEAQIILKYSCATPPPLSTKPISFREIYTTISHESPPKFSFAQIASHSKERAVGIELLCGDSLLGVGEGYSIQEAMHEACMHMILNYYLKRQALELEEWEERKPYQNMSSQIEN